jgi:hypothetical protein
MCTARSPLNLRQQELTGLTHALLLQKPLNDLANAAGSNVEWRTLLRELNQLTQAHMRPSDKDWLIRNNATPAVAAVFRQAHIALYHCERGRLSRQSHRNQRRNDVAAVQGVVPRHPEFRRKSRKLKDLSILGVQFGFEPRHESTEFCHLRGCHCLC